MAKFEPLVSCVMATGRRKVFLRQAIKYFNRQEYENKELIIVDDDEDPALPEIPDQANIKYISMDERAFLGRKLNIGIAASSGEIIQKLDDDDWYSPTFLDRTVQKIGEKDPERSASTQTGFLVHLMGSDNLYFSGFGVFTGATLAFHKKIWERRPLNEEKEVNLEHWFRNEHTFRFASISDVDQFVAVRHRNGHLMRKICGIPADDYFAARPYRKAIEDIMPADDIAFYRSLGGVVK